VVALALLLVAALCRLATGRPPDAAHCRQVDLAPRLRPALAEVVIPPNVAPVNFVVSEPGARYWAAVSGPSGRAVTAAGSDGAMVWPPRAWRALLAANRGQELTIDVRVRSTAGGWTRFAPVTLRVAAEAIEDFLVYRRFQPFFNSDGPLTLRQRDLRSFAESVLVDREDLSDGCMNCHTFLDRRPDQFLFHVRAEQGQPTMVLASGGAVRTIDTRDGPKGRPAGYSSWHPSGQLIAFSRNRILQYFPQVGAQSKAALDAVSSLAVLDLRTGRTTTPEALNPPGRLPTFPCWSPDGRWLYFASAPMLWAEGAMPIEQQRDLRYDLMRASYDPASGAFGAPETVVAAADTGRSALEPRVSPDGHWLLFCLCDCGSFPVFQKESDLYLLDLTQPGARPTAVEPAEATRHDSWHTWSGNSRWIVCSSKRDNGLLARPYLRYLDADGHAAKPFALPQRDPQYYDDCLTTFNVPELVSGPIHLDRAALRRIVPAATGAGAGAGAGASAYGAGQPSRSAGATPEG